MAYRLTKEALVLDLCVAFYCAKRHKSNKSYVHKFEENLEENIEKLADELLNRTYTPEPSNCFIIEYPKKREVFAAQFRDRIVHHLYFNYTHEMFECTFIEDTYSCIKNRGTHYGIQRLAKHIRQESRNYTVPCYVLKLDIRGYFIHINKNILLDNIRSTVTKMASRSISKKSPQTWSDVIDIDFVLWLGEEIISTDPKKDCRFACGKEEWKGLDVSKSLFYTDENCGLPIGNLTSQLFSNVYLNTYDQYMKRELKCKHYGRYVDDSYVVSSDKKWLLSIVSKVRRFLKEKLSLRLHEGKVIISDIRKGVEFLGAFIKPYRNYASSKTIRRMVLHIDNIDCDNMVRAWSSTNSFLGVLSHYKSYNIRSNIFLTERLLSLSSYNRGLTKMNKPYLLT